MKKMVVMILTMIACSLSLFGGGYTIDYTGVSDTEYIVDVTLADQDVSLETIDGSEYSVINFTGSFVTRDKGYAELPGIAESYRILPDTHAYCKIIEQKSIVIKLDAPLKPSRGVIYRNQNPADIPYTIAPSSLSRAAYPGTIAELSKPFILRDVRGVTLKIQPFQYNAITRELTVYTKLRIAVLQDYQRATNILTSDGVTNVGEIQGFYRSVFRNYHDESREPTIGELGDILVIYTARDKDAVRFYIDWKREKGFNVKEVQVSPGTNVKHTVMNEYQMNTNILYVQLVGDWQDIRSDLDQNGAPMDPMLGCVVGADNIPDIIVGRFSVNNPDELMVQIEKVINYERNPDLSDDWYTRGIGISSHEGPGDDGEYDFQHMQIIRDNKLLPSGFTAVTQAHHPYIPSTELVTDDIIKGASVINYTGHGNKSGWKTSSYTSTVVKNLYNAGRLPVIFSVACVVGEFHTDGDCFAETWLKQPNGGAVAAWMSTINQPWQPPMRGQDYAMDLLTGGYDYTANPGNGISTTEGRSVYGSLCLNASILMYVEDSSASSLDTLRTWTIFGDASLQIRTKQTQPIVLENDIIPIGTYKTRVTTPAGLSVPGAVVSLYQAGNTYSSVTDSDGRVSITHGLINGECKLVVSGANLATLYETKNIGGGPTPTPPVTPTPTTTPYQVNIAPGKYIQASAEYSAEFKATHANDGNDGTAWGTVTNNKAQWIYIDLGKATLINELKLNWLDQYYPVSYKVAVSNDKQNWNFVYTATKNKPGPDTITSDGTVRYIGIYCTAFNSFAVALKEFEVYQNH